MKKRQLRELQGQLRAGLKPSGEYAAPAVTVITIQMPDQTVIGIKATEVTIELERDFLDATRWNSPMKTYAVGPRTFTIKGTM